MNQANNNKDVHMMGGNNWAVLSGYDLIRLQTYNEIRNVIYMFDRVIKPILSERIQNLDSYAEKLFNYAFVYAAVDKEILGFIAFYANDTKTNIAYLTQIAVQPVAKNRRVGRMLLDKCIEVSKSRRMRSLKLEVYKVNSTAIRFYKRNGFKFCGESSEDSMYMIRKL